MWNGLDIRTSIHDWAETIQAVVIILATIFTARWTYRTFSHKERMQELKDFAKAVEEYHKAMTMYCAVIHPDEVTESEIEEKMRLAGMHNRLLRAC